MIKNNSTTSLTRLTLLANHTFRSFPTSYSGTHPLYDIEHVKQDRSIILTPRHTHHKYSLIWLHGLGDSANGFADIFLDEHWRFTPDTCKVILLTAPERPVTLNEGMVMNSWYDIKSLKSKVDSLEQLYAKYS